MATDLQNARAYKLSEMYGLNPAKQLNKGNKNLYNNGKYEPDWSSSGDTITYLLAHPFDKTNVLVRFNPDELDES